jgi:multicomponent Na+:H+ antiporter subunit D
VLLASSFLNAAYFIPILYRAYFKEDNSNYVDKNHATNGPDGIKENPFLVIPLTVTALVSIILGIYPDFIVRIAKLSF